MDWKKLLADLSDEGVTQAEIAKLCDCGQSTISELSRGLIKEPGYSTGRLLESLHAERCLARKRSKKVSGTFIGKEPAGKGA